MTINLASLIRFMREIKKENSLKIFTHCRILSKSQKLTQTNECFLWINSAMRRLDFSTSPRRDVSLFIHSTGSGNENIRWNKAKRKRTMNIRLSTYGKIHFSQAQCITDLCSKRTSITQSELFFATTFREYQWIIFKFTSTSRLQKEKKLSKNFIWTKKKEN